MKRILLILLCLVIVISGCTNKKGFTVKGTVKGENHKYIYLKRLEVDTPVMLDSSKVSSNGQFRFKVKANEPEFYQLGYSANDFITLLAEPGEKIKVTFQSDKLYEKYTIEGSTGSEKLQELDNELASTKAKLDSLSTLYAKESSNPGFEIRGKELEEQFNTILKNQRRKSIGFIINNTTSFASIKALYQKINEDTYVLYDRKDLQYFKIVTDSLTARYPNSKQVQALASYFKREMNQMYFDQIQQIAQNAPETKLDPTLLNTAGKRISLSSLKGKYVLLTFWSMQVRECVEENLQLKELYNTYKGRGFEIYQINLDQDENAWKAAVKFDELPWISTREDDPADPVNARLFNVKSLPYNYLFDRDGKIIATNLHGKALQIRLGQIFTK